MATFKRVMVTPARLFEFLTTLTFGALRRNHMVSTVFETVVRKAKKKEQKQGGLAVHVRSTVCDELSRTPPKLEGNVAWKKDLTSMAVQKKLQSVIVHKSLRRGVTSITVIIN